jgi:hypothetical protein
MSVTAILLLGFGLADILSARRPLSQRPVTVALAIAGCSVGVAYLLGFTTWRPWVLGDAILMVVLPWLLAKTLSATAASRCVRALIRSPRVQLSWILGMIALSVALAHEFPAVGGPFGNWFSELPLPGAHHATATQAALIIGSTIFLLATTNRIIRLTLEAVGGQLEAGESKLKGGRYIGPIERLIVAALILAGSLEGAGLIIAAKGFIRLPEIRSETEKEGGVGDAIAEYFLIGTLTSIAIAALLAALVLATK